MALIRSGARALSCPSRCQKLDKISFAAEILQEFSPTLKRTQTNLKSSVIWVGQRKRYGKSTLLICEVYMK